MTMPSSEPPRPLMIRHRPSWSDAIALGVVFTLIAMAITGHAGANWQRCALVGAGLILTCLLFNMCCRFRGSPVRADRLRGVLYISPAFLVLLWGGIELVAAGTISVAGFAGQCAALVLAVPLLWYAILPGEIRMQLRVGYGISLDGDDKEGATSSTDASGCRGRLKALGSWLAFGLVGVGGALGIGAARVVDKAWPETGDIITFYVCPMVLMLCLEFGIVGALNMWFHIGQWEKQSGRECPPPLAKHEQEPDDRG